MKSTTDSQIDRVKITVIDFEIAENDEISSGMGCTFMRPAAGTITVL